MSNELVACILRPRSQRGSDLIHLELNDLSQWSMTAPPLPKFPHLRDLQDYYEHQEHGRDQRHVLVLESRQMIDALDPLTGHYPHLTSLRIAIRGPSEEPGPESREVRLYQSCARFIDSVRMTLRKLEYEQGYSYNEEGHWYDHDYSRTEHIFPRPMDRMFARHILPVLMEGPWPCMEQIDIRGVGVIDREISRGFPLTETELNSEDVEYIDLFPGDSGQNQQWTFDLVVKAFPGTEKMQLDLQNLIPQATIVVEEDGEQDFESFIEDSHGITHESRWA